MKTYTTWDAVSDMFIIYSIVIIISMLVATIIRGIVILLSRQVKTEIRDIAPVKSMTADVNKTVIISEIPQEHIAAISAAITLMIGMHRIVHIEIANRSFGWTSEARTTHHTSHAPRAPH